MDVESDDEGPKAAQAGPAAPLELPHHVLFVDNLPAETEADMLTTLFQQ